MIRTILLAVLCFPLCAQELLPRIVVDSSIDQSKIDISGLWAREVLPKIVRLSGQATLPESITFKRCEDNSYGGGTYENPEICIAYSDSFSYKTDDIGVKVYRTITHEVGHALSPYGINSFQNLDEGLAEAMERFVYAELERQNPAVRTGSYVFVQDLLNNLDIHAAAETSNFYTHRGYPYQASGGTLELLLRTEEDFRAVGRAIEDRNWTFSGAKDCAETQACPGTISIADYAEQLQIIQRALNERKVAGVSVSTFLDRILASRYDGPDGRFLFVLPENADNGVWAPGTYPPVNPGILSVRYFDRKDGIVSNVDQATTVTWSIHYGSSEGQEMVPETASEITGDWPLVLLPDMSSWPEGGYVVNAKIGDIATVNYFVVLRDPQWKYGGMLVITNGPDRFDQLTDFPELTPSPECGDMQVLPGLLRFTRTTGDCMLTDPDGKETTFASHPYYSPIHLLKRRDQPIVDAVVDSATYQVGPVTPGSWLSLFGFGFTHGDPDAPTSLPLPFTGCDGTVSVMFADGVHDDVPGSLSYCSGRQINVQVPQGLPEGDYQVVVRLNAQESKTAAQELVTYQPKIFVIAPDLGAITHADGGLVYQANPAQPGETLVLYGMGLGPVSPDPPETGKPADVPPLHHAMTSTEVMLGGSASCQVEFAGLAPWLVGVYQVNFMVPLTASGPTYQLAISSGGKTSNEVTLWVNSQ